MLSKGRGRGVNIKEANLGDVVRIVGANRMQLDGYTILLTSATGDID